jgi:hypothetical protein
MSTLTFYRQARVDGGIRTGVEFDGTVLLGRFDEGNGDYDPALEWYLDLEFNGDSLPDDAASARQWLLDHSPFVAVNLGALAEQIRIGLDFDPGPARVSSHLPDQNVRIEIRCSAMRRFKPHELSTIVSELAAHWDRLISDLPAVEPVTP